MNKKIKKIFLMLLVIISLGNLTSCDRGQRVVEDFPTAVNSLESYKVVGKLTSYFPSRTKESLITVYYKNPDLYRVEVDNMDLGDKQIVLKNKEGVHILIPSLNKTFKVKSSWPFNSSYPYLLQSLCKDMLNDEERIEIHEDDQSSVEMKVKVFEDSMPYKQKIIFNNKTGFPSCVLVYDEKENLITKFSFDKLEININLDNDLFNNNKTLESMREHYQDAVDTYVRSITYPTYYPEGVSLKEELIKGTTLKTAIMKYEGVSSFTIVEEYLMESDTVVTSFVDGDIYIMGGIIALINPNTIFFGEQGVEYTIASSNMNILEMIKMGDSLLVGSEK